MNNNNKNKIILVGILLILGQPVSVVSASDHNNKTESWIDIPQTTGSHDSDKILSFSLSVESVVSKPSSSTSYNFNDSVFRWYPVKNSDSIQLGFEKTSVNQNKIKKVRVKVLSHRTKTFITSKEFTDLDSRDDRVIFVNLDAILFPVSSKAWLDIEVTDIHNKASKMLLEVATLVPLKELFEEYPVWFHTFQWGEGQSAHGERARLCGLHLYVHGVDFPSDLHAKQEIDVWLTKSTYNSWLDPNWQGNKTPPEDWGATINLSTRWDKTVTISGNRSCWWDHWLDMSFNSHAKVFRRDDSYKSEGFINNRIELKHITIKFDGDHPNRTIRYNTSVGQYSTEDDTANGYGH